MVNLANIKEFPLLFDIAVVRMVRIFFWKIAFWMVFSLCWFFISDLFTSICICTLNQYATHMSIQLVSGMYWFMHVCMCMVSCILVFFFAFMICMCMHMCCTLLLCMCVFNLIVSIHNHFGACTQIHNLNEPLQAIHRKPKGFHWFPQNHAKAAILKDFDIDGGLWKTIWQKHIQTERHVVGLCLLSLLCLKHVSILSLDLISWPLFYQTKRMG